MPMKHVFVTSGVRGIGLATTRTLLRDGWSVAFTYHHSEAEARALEDEAAGYGNGVRALGIQADLHQETELDKALRTAEAHFGSPQAVVHNYGPFVFSRMSLADYSDTNWNRLFEGNLQSFWWLARRVIPKMRTQNFGRIVTMGSDGADGAAGWRYRAPYAATKAALASLTRSIAAEERDYGITANMVCPGDLRNDQKELLERPRAEQTTATLNQLAVGLQLHSANRLSRNHQHVPSLTPELVGGDIARTVALFCRPESAHLTGCIVAVTSGVNVRALDAERQLDE